MTPGGVLLIVAFLAALGSAALYAPSLRGRRIAAASWLFDIHAAAVASATLLLAYYFIAHRFDYEYVTRYSSRALAPPLALAALWAGQEGSILLWAALAAFIGLALKRQPGRLAQPAMLFVSATQLFFLVLLFVRTPFARSPVIPADGQGLNALLEDPWMVIHPPVLFAGYASMLIPFALAAAALLLRDYREWNRMAWPWVLMAVVTLGAGIVLGGAWAYKVLGWGGYWGWDPVENASLIPWLVAVATLHGLLIQRTTGALVRTNILLSLLGWLAVLGGTYLTRSGVLQDFSVHSFAESGLNGPLSAFLLLSFALGALLLAGRWREIPAGPAQWGNLSRESALWLGMVTVLVLAALVTVGTTSPLLTSMLGNPANVQARFYELVSVPLGVALALLMGVAPALRWSRQQGLSWFAWLAPGLLGGAAAAAAAMFAGMRDAGHVALTGATGAALVVNAVMSVRLFRRGIAYGAGYLGHAGVGVMILGMVLCAAFGKTERARLPLGEPVQVMGYTLTFQGERHESRGQQLLEVRMDRPGWSLVAAPRLFPGPQGGGVVRKPAIANWGELYLSPIEVVAGEQRSDEPVWLEQGKERVVDDVGYTFTGFRLESGKELTVLADIRVRTRDRSLSVAPAMLSGASGRRPRDAVVEGVGAVSLAQVDADRRRVAVGLPASAAPRVFAFVDLSTRPWISLVWIGAVLALLGTIVAGLRRAAETTPASRRA